MIRWSVRLSGYNYKLVYRPGEENGNADCLSRLPYENPPKEIPVPGEIKRVVEQIDATLSVKMIKMWTKTDPVLSKVTQFVNLCL